MTHKEFIGLVVASPLAILFGFKKFKLPQTLTDAWGVRYPTKELMESEHKRLVALDKNKAKYVVGSIKNTFDHHLIVDGRIWSFNKGFLNG